MSVKLEGIVSPAIDRLMAKEDDQQHKMTKYGLVIFASKRARQINDYCSSLQDGSLFNVVGPLVDATTEEKALTIAMREIDQDKLELHAATE